MNPAEYWRAIRRRWIDVVLAVGVALAAGWAITSVAPAGPVSTTYEATAVVVQTGDPYTVGSVTNLDAVAALSTIGQVPRRVADAADYDGDPADLVAQMKVEVSREAGVIRYTATAGDEDEAVRLANTFARQTRLFLVEQRSQTTAEQLAYLAEQLDTLETEIQALDQQLDTAPPDDATTLQAQRDAKVRQYGLAYEQYQFFAQSPPDTGGLDVVAATAAVPKSSGGLQAPRSRTARLIIAGLLGLISGVVIVLVADRFDRRIRTRDGAEKAFDLPVLAEVPFIPRWKRRATDIVTVTEPRSHAADAFRIVTMMLSMRGLTETGNGNGHGNGVVLERDLGTTGSLPPVPPGADDREPARTILVTSPGPDDGKTTIAANLAAAFAARGARALVFSCDLRRPHVHRLLGVENEYGLVDALSRADGKDPWVPVLPSSLERVLVVPSGRPPEDPGEILASGRMRHALLRARAEADVVIIDTAPILATSDAIPLIPTADAVLLVARSGRTTFETARRTTELLRRLGAPIAGVMLNAAAEINLPRRYYYSRYHRSRRSSKRSRGNPRLARPSGRL